MAHELHHAKRILQGPGFGTTLADALVAEGSAEAFVRELYPDAPAIPWVRPLSRAEAERVWDEAQLDQHQRTDAAMRDAWFFGGKSLPRWAGYRLGYAIARAYLARYPTVTAADMATLATADIFVNSAYDPSATPS
jgi:uncharacterized protein YjaZ